MLVTIDRLKKFTTAPSNGTIADSLYVVPLNHRTFRYRRQIEADDKLTSYYMRDQ